MTHTNQKQIMVLRRTDKDLEDLITDVKKLRGVPLESELSRNSMIEIMIPITRKYMKIEKNI